MITDRQSCEKKYDNDVCVAANEDFQACKRFGGNQNMCGSRMETSAVIMQKLRPMLKDDLKNNFQKDIINLGNTDECAQRYAGLDMDAEKLNDYCTFLTKVESVCTEDMGLDYLSWCKMSVKYTADNALSTYNGIKASVPQWKSESNKNSLAALGTDGGYSEQSGNQIGALAVISAGGLIAGGAAALGYAAYRGIKALKNKACGKKTAADREAVELSELGAQQAPHMKIKKTAAVMDTLENMNKNQAVL